VKNKGWAAYAPLLTMYPRADAKAPSQITCEDELCDVLATLPRLEVGDVLVSQSEGGEEGDEKDEVRVLSFEMVENDEASVFCISTEKGSFVVRSGEDIGVLVHNITITIQTLTGRTIRLDLDSSCTIDTLKVKCCNALGYSFLFFFLSIISLYYFFSFLIFYLN
jgi:hypothetical protein